MKNALIALLACGTLSTLAVPARADNAVIQDGYQTSVITGIGNTNVQQSAQDAYLNGFGYPENTGYVQRQVQGSDIYGAYNSSYQGDRQTISSNFVNTTYYPNYDYLLY